MCHPGHRADDHHPVDVPGVNGGKKFFPPLGTDALPLRHPPREHGSLTGLIIVRVFAVFILAFVVGRHLPEPDIRGCG